jgi:hypothetical protein
LIGHFLRLFKIHLDGKWTKAKLLRAEKGNKEVKAFMVDLSANWKYKLTMVNDVIELIGTCLETVTMGK